MPRPEQDDPSDLDDLLVWSTILLCCIASAVVAILGLVIGLVVWLIIG
jgi:hypothetical protein